MKTKITITIEFEQFKSNIVNSLKEEIKQDAIEKAHLINNNAIIIKKHNEILKNLHSFLTDNLDGLPVGIEEILYYPASDGRSNGFVGIKSKNVSCNFLNGNACFGFRLLPQSSHSHKHNITVLDGKFKLSILTKYEDTVITMEEIGQIFEKGRGTLKEIILKDFLLV